MSASPTKSSEGISLAKVMGQIAHALNHVLSSGDVAELRRLAPTEPGSPAFFKLAALYLEPSGFLPRGGQLRDDAERKWAAILAGMATIGHLLTPGRRLGEALVMAGFSELRFVRLLRAQDQKLLDLARLSAKFLAAKGEGVDWTDMASLVLSEGQKHEENVRRSIARDYYRAVSNEKKTQ